MYLTKKKINNEKSCLETNLLLISEYVLLETGQTLKVLYNNMFLSLHIMQNFVCYSCIGMCTYFRYKILFYFLNQF